MKPKSCKAIFPTKWRTVSKNSVSDVSPCDLTDPVWGWLDTFSWLSIPVTVSFLSIMLCWLKIKTLLMGQGLASWCGAKHYPSLTIDTKHRKILLLCLYMRLRWKVKWNKKGKQSHGWTCFRCWACALCDHPWVCLSWSRCTLSVQHRFTDKVHFLKDNGMKVQ